MSFPGVPVWPGFSRPHDPLGQPGVSGLGQEVRRWAALLALAAALLPFTPGPGRSAQGSSTPVAAPASPAGTAELAPSLLPDDPWESAVVESAPPAPAPAVVPAATSQAQAATAEERPRAIAAGAAPIVPASREPLRRSLVRYAQEHGLPADLVMAQAWKESSWRARAVSEDGATGVMQLMPATVEYVSRKLLKLNRNLDPFDPVANIRMGTRYMRYLVDRFGGDYRRALIAYNQGVTSLLNNGPYGEAASYADAVYALRAEFSA